MKSSETLTYLEGHLSLSEIISLLRTLGTPRNPYSRFLEIPLLYFTLETPLDVS
jgi:hypothetical protein